MKKSLGLIFSMLFLSFIVSSTKSITNTSSVSCYQRQNFHASAISLAKKHPKQIKKENIAKRVQRLAEYERTKPSHIVSKSTPFFHTLQTPAAIYNGNAPLYQHFLNKEDQQFLFEENPKISVEKNHLTAIGGVEDALNNEKHKVEALQKVISLQNGNAKAIQLWNVHQAVDWFKRKEGDTGSPEVQGMSNFYKRIYRYAFRFCYSSFFFFII